MTAAIVGLPKSLDANGGATGEATPFIVYGYFTCNPVGYPAGAAQDLANAHLLSREEAMVENALWTGSLGNTPNLQGATKMAGGSPIAPDAAVALLEDHLAANYGSLGVLHMTRGAALQLAGISVLETVGGRLQTKVGTPVAAGAGYPGTGPAGEAPGAGTSWVFITPAIFGYRGEVLTSSNSPGDLFDRSSNVLTAIAERQYLIGFDPCGLACAQLDLL